QLRHPHVEDHHVGLGGDGALHRLAPVGGFSHHLEPRLGLEQRAQPLAHHLVIVGDEDAGAVHHSLRINARTSVPGLAGRISSLPPNCETRSRIPAMPTPTGGELCALSRSSTSEGIPTPWSSTSSRISGPMRRSRTEALVLPECRCTLVRLSCTIRKRVISSSVESRPSSSGRSSVTSTLLRWPNPCTYQRSDAGRPASSSSGGCSKCDKV